MRFDDPEPTQLLNGYAPHLNRKCVLKLSKRLFRSHAWGICRHADKCAQNWGKCFSMLFFPSNIFRWFSYGNDNIFWHIFSFINNYNYLLCHSLNMTCYRDSKKNSLKNAFENINYFVWASRAYVVCFGIQALCNNINI